MAHKKVSLPDDFDCAAMKADEAIGLGNNQNITTTSRFGPSEVAGIVVAAAFVIIPVLLLSVSYFLSFTRQKLTSTAFFCMASYG